MAYIEKLPARTVLRLTEEVPVAPEQVTSMSLVQRNDLGISVFSLDKGQAIGGHAATGDAMVTLLSGQAKITIDQEAFIVSAGETIIMPATIRHSLYAIEAFQMLLVVVKPQEAKES